MTAIQFNKKYKIERACSNDITRWPLMTPFYKDGVLRATDGYILAHVKVEDGVDIPTGPLNVELIERGRRNVHGDTVVLHQNDNGMMQHGGERVWFERETEEQVGKFPNTQNILDDVKSGKNLGKHKIAINPTLLLKLAEALGSSTNIIMHIGENKNDECTYDPIYVQVPGDPSVEGVIMPIRANIPKVEYKFPAGATPVDAVPEPIKAEIDI